MRNLKQLRADMALVASRIAGLESTKRRAEREAQTAAAEIARLRGDGVRVAVAAIEKMARGNGKPEGKPAGALSAFILAQKLPAKVATLAERSKQAGFSGKTNAVASAAAHDKRLRLVDGQVRRATKA